MDRRIPQITAAASVILIVCGLAQSMHDTQLIKRSETAEKHLETRIFENVSGGEAEDHIGRMKEINPDFAALLEFESGLIRLPVVQGSDNSFYLDHLFDGSEGIAGSLFFDMQCEADDPVRIIYGHSVFSKPQLMFTPLHRLCSQSAYEENRIFTLDDGERTETYEIISVFINDEGSDNAQDTRIRRFMDDEERAAFLNEVMKRSLVMSDTGHEGEGKIVILQTCMDADSLRRLCVIGLQIMD